MRKYIIMYWFKRKWRQIKRVADFLPIIWKGFLVCTVQARRKELVVGC